MDSIPGMTGKRIILAGFHTLTGSQQVADPVERIVSAAAVAVDLLLYPSADFVDGGGAELDDVECVEDRDGVFQLVIDGVLVAVERVQGRDRDAFAERVAAGLQPRLVGLTGAARDEIQQPGPDVSVLVTGQINHAGELFRPPASEVDGLGGDVMPDVFVDAKTGDPGEPGLVRGSGLQHRLDRPPQCLPGAAQLPGQALDRGVLPPHLPDRPPGRASSEQRPAWRHLGVLLHERGHRAHRLGTHPSSFPPPQPHRPAEARRVDQLHPLPPMSMRHDPAGGATHHRRRPGLDLYPQPGVVAFDADHMEPRQADQKIATLAVAPGSSATGSRIRHRRGPRVSGGVVTPILEGLDPSHPTDTPTAGATLTPRSSQKSPATRSVNAIHPEFVSNVGPSRIFGCVGRKDA